MHSSVYIYTKLRIKFDESNRFCIIHSFSIGKINKCEFLFSLKQNCTYLR